jgi:hypothetical protein
MKHRIALALALCAVFGFAIGPPEGGAAQRVWQTGTWHDVKVERPRVMLGVQSRDPNSNVPRTAPVREIRTYVIETDSLRLELRQEVAADVPRIDATIGGRVTFALDKKTVYIKDEDGKEHKLTVRKQTNLSAAQPKH